MIQSHRCEPRNSRKLEAKLDRLERQRAEIVEAERLQRERLEHLNWIALRYLHLPVTG